MEYQRSIVDGETGAIAQAVASAMRTSFNQTDTVPQLFREPREAAILPGSAFAEVATPMSGRINRLPPAPDDRCYLVLARERSSSANLL